MFKFGKSEAPEEARDKTDNFILGEQAQVEERQRDIQEREEALKSLQDRRLEVREKVDEILERVSAKSDEGSFYDDFANDAELPKLKAELAQLDEDISRFDDLYKRTKVVKAKEVNLEKLKSENEEIKSIEAEIQKLSKDPNGEREASHKKVAEDVDVLVETRLRHLKDKDKAEAIIDILSSLENEQKIAFISKLKPEDVKLYEDYISGDFIKAHEAELESQSEKQDTELHAVREGERQKELYSRTFGGFEIDKDIKKWEGYKTNYKIGDKIERKRKYGSREFEENDWRWNYTRDYPEFKEGEIVGFIGKGEVPHRFVVEVVIKVTEGEDTLFLKVPREYISEFYKSTGIKGVLQSIRTGWF